jgi:amino acid adenylation domain-containing protein
MVGLFINTIPVRICFEEKMKFCRLLQKIQEDALAGESYHYHPLAEIQSRTALKQNLIDHILVFENYPIAEQIKGYGREKNKSSKPGLKLTNVEIFEQSNYDFNVILGGSDRLAITFLYNGNVYEEDFVERIAKHFSIAVDQVIENQELAVRELTLLSEEEKNRILYEFNDTAVEYPKDKTIHQLFEEQVERTPDNIALHGCMIAWMHGEVGAITCKELNEKSNRLAHVLQTKGVGPDTIVGIMVERSVEMIVGIMGILKSGGAYLPIDPDYPQERIDYMLKDSGAKLLVTTDHISSSAFSASSAVKNLLPAAGHWQPATSLAYIMYTSGTTGGPKGVLVPHKNVVRLVKNTNYIELTKNTRILQTGAPVFDATTFEIWGSLLNGGQLVLIEKEVILNARQLGEALKRFNINTLWLSSSLFNQLLENDPGIFSPLAYLLVGGDALSPTHINRLKKTFSELAVINGYGPTENTTFSTTYRIRGEFESNIPIGRPIANSTAYIVDRDGHLQPIGVSGELVVGGEGLSRGYLNRPELTAEKFVSYRLPVAGRRLYKTGDLGRWLPDGNVEFLGRIDFQVKIRGYRIELGEIEQQLLSYDGIEAAAVIVIIENGENYLSAYFTAEKKIEIPGLRDSLAKKLPYYMIPSYLNQIESIPLTTNGKIDRKTLASIEHKIDTEIEFVSPQNETEKIVAAIWKEVLGVEQVGIHDNFFNIGGNSLKLITLSTKLNAALRTNVPVAKLFEHVTISAFARYYAGKETGGSPAGRVIDKSNTMVNEIAIIGMAGRFPGARNINEFWNNLKNGIESITFMSDEELKKSGIEPELIKNPNYVKVRGGVLEDGNCFDASFFDYTAPEAAITDPQTRVFHECAREAFENAGYNPSTYEGAIGVYAGASPSSSWEGLMYLSGKSEMVGGFATTYLANKDFMCTRIAYKLDLKGPAVNIQNACSTSLVTVHMACQAIFNGECDMALAGGVSVSVNQSAGYLYQEGMIASPDGHCRAFDADARGTVSGNGTGAVVLKPLKNALASGDYIYAIIRGTAINNDGFVKASYTAPSIKGQAAVIQAALQMAKVDPETITYVETHGTGTALGDPIEIEALKQAYDTDKKQYCAIGSVKTNIGHLDAAAGITGLIKAVLSLKNKLIPPSLHFETPNPNIDFDNSPFYVNFHLKEWKNGRYPLRAGVSAFGIGGTNAHVILEEWPENQEALFEQTPPPVLAPAKTLYYLIILSAKTPSALEKMRSNLAHHLHHLQTKPGITLENIAFTLQRGREAFPYRGMAVCSTLAETASILSPAPPGHGKFYTSVAGKEKPPMVFMFPGLGAQYDNMGRELYETEPVFRQEIDYCTEILESLIRDDIKDIFQTGVESTLTQPAVFTLEYALAKLLTGWGITPDAMIGYSFGEYTAACIAGVFSPEDALQLLVQRGQLIEKTQPGAMLSVPLPQQELKPLLPGDLCISIDNGLSCLVSGPVHAVEAFEAEMKKRRYLCLRLPASRAIHSSLMNPIMEEFEDKVRGIRLNKPQIPYISNLSGTWITAREAINPRYWVRHLRETVRFGDGIKELVKKPGVIFLEVGPGSDLTALVMRFMGDSTERKVLDLIRRPGKKVSDHFYLLNKIGQLWLHGIHIDWDAFHTGRGGKKGRRIPLPTYPFAREQYGSDGGAYKKEIAAAIERLKPPAAETPGIEDWFSIPSWKRSILLPVEKEGNEKQSKNRARHLVFLDNCGLGSAMKKRFEKDDHDVVTVTPGTRFEKLEVGPYGAYTINPSQEKDYHTLFRELVASEYRPRQILHLWGVTNTETPVDENSLERFDRAQAQGFYSLLYLAKAMEKCGCRNNAENDGGTVDILVVTDGMQELAGGDLLCPEKASLLGPVHVIPQEYPGVACRSIDIFLPSSAPPETLELIAEHLWAECTDYAAPGAPGSGHMVALRGNHRWVQTFEALRLEEPLEQALPLKEKGVYLITGGLGNIGFTLAKYLAGNFRARLVLTGRSAVRSGPGGRRDEKIEELETLGAEVMVFNADVADKEQMRQVFRQAEERFGKIDGVIHAAGIIGKKDFAVIGELKDTLCREHFRVKCHGLLILAELLKGKYLDFFWVMSSISTVLGGLGFAAYAAANAFMDAYTASHNRGSGQPWISVDWDGMAPVETVNAFRRVLSLSRKRVNRVAVSTGGGLQQRIDRWIEQVSVSVSLDEPASTAKPRPMLMTPYEAPLDPVEQSVANVWQQLFGFDKIGSHDDFFELGGDSLKAIHAIACIHKALNVEIPLKEFFKRLTVESLAVYIKSVEKNAFSTVEPAEKKEYYGLSSAQKRLYFLQQMDKEGIGYNIPLILILEGIVDKDKLEQSIRGLIRRHESLRTSIDVIEEEPVQRIHEDVKFAIEHYDLSGDNEIENSKFKIQNSFVRPFDLSQAPLLRVRLIKVEKDRHIFLVDMHHIISDGISIQVLVHDFSALYAGKELPGIKLQYKDYAEWQNRERESRKILEQGEYWKKEYEGEIPVLELPTDYARPAVQGFEGNSINFEINKETVGALKNLALETGTTLYIVLLTLYTIFLSKLSSQEDIAIGTPVAGRRHADLEKIIGMFVNTLVLRNYPSGEKGFMDFLGEVKEIALKGFENQECQYEDLVEKVAVTRDVSRNPLFDTMFALQNTGSQKIELPGLKLVPYEYENKTSKFDLTLDVVEVEEKLLFIFEYSTKLFKLETVEKFIVYFKNIVRSIVENKKLKISDLEILTEEEKNRILFEFNDTEAEYPKDKSIHRLFEEQVERTPDLIALVGLKLQNTKYKIQTKYKSQITNNKQSSALRADFDAFGVMRLTYKELNEQSNRLAHYLHEERNIRPGALVGLMMDQSIDGVIAILGILKTGGAYLPIDPEYPQERIDYMLKDSGAKILLTELPEGPKHHHSSNQFIIHNCNNLAYVLYTSGTTGRPKGVMVEHRSVVNLVHWFGQTYGLQAGVNLLQLTGYSFDPSVEDIFSTLVHGASLVVASRALLADMIKLREFIRAHQIHIIDFIPALLDELLCGGEKPDSLRVVISGGEKLEDSLKDRLLALGYRLYNHYGPTEITVDALVSECSQDKVTLGIPIANTQCFILDRDNNLAAPGVPGELCISGVGIARGYLNRPELTAEKFIMPSATRGSFEKPPLDPAKLLFNHHSPLYRTSDRCCWLPDGNIRFFGRIDDQIKIRGYRVELQEIENVLKSHKKIKDAVVLTRENKESKAEIYAYYVDDTRISPVVWPSVGEYPLYDDYIYYAMTNDVVRNNSYKAAIGRRAAGKVVVEIGTGKDVILARFCLEAGARIVYAIEISEDSFKKAQQTVKDLGLQDKIVLIHGDATSVEIPEGADICLSELIGTIGGSEGAAAILKIARRLLKEDGEMIPGKCITKIAAVQLPLSIHQSPAFSRISSQYVETLYRYSGHPFDFRVCIDNFPISNVISSDGIFEYLDFSGQIETEGQSNAELVISKDGRMDGFLLWLNLYTCPGVLIDNLVNRHNWAPVFIPVMYPGIAVSTGDRIRMTCSWGLSRNGINPDYRLEGVLILKDGTEISFQYELPYFETAFRKNPFYRQLLIDNPASYARNIFEYLDQRQLRKYLEAHLPSYMMPSHLIELEKIPLTANGKVDTKALPDISITPVEEYVAPRNEDEEKLVGAWAEALEIEKEKIGINDNFFDLGGNSLKIIRLSRELEKVLDKEIPVLILFRYSTVRALSEYLNRGGLPGKVFLDADKLGKIEDSIQDTLEIFGDN